MEREEQDILMKVRSSRACVAGGYRLFTANFRRILRHSLVAALVLAVVGGAYTTYTDLNSPRLIMAIIAIQQGGVADLSTVGQLMGAMTLGVLLVAVAYVVFISYGMSQLRNHHDQGFIPYPTRWFTLDRPMLWRTVKAALWMSLASMVLVGLTGAVTVAAMMYLGGITGLVVAAIAILAVLLLALPLYYVEIKYLMDHSSGFVATLRKGYGVGLRHLGLMITVAIIDLITALIATFITTMPSLILTQANLQAQMGVLNGDPLGMPEHIGWLMLVVFAIAQFVRAYILLSAVFPLYFAYGSIEVREQESRKSKQIITGLDA